MESNLCGLFGGIWELVMNSFTFSSCSFLYRQTMPLQTGMDSWELGMLEWLRMGKCLFRVPGREIE